jgi:hypothetical protein
LVVVGGGSGGVVGGTGSGGWWVVDGTWIATRCSPSVCFSTRSPIILLHPEPVKPDPRTVR